MKYQVAEKFRSIQGEGVYAGTPMAFIRFVGCSVGKKICQHCDTDFEKTIPWQGGGEYTVEELREWVGNYQHVCLTGGEPLDQELEALLYSMHGVQFHLETSGTKTIPTYNSFRTHLWICVSPKPGFLEEVVMEADEVKVIVPGLGTEDSLTLLHRRTSGSEPGTVSGMGHIYALRESFRWPTLEDAKRWAAAGKVVFLQPRNGKFDIDQNKLRLVQDILVDNPELRLSVQMHKVLKVQ